MENNAPALTTEILLECLRQRREVLLALRNLTDAQRNPARGGDASITLGILGRKEGLLDELSRIHEQLRPFREEDPDQRVWASPDRRRECQRIADEGQQLLQEILRTEETTLYEVTTQRDAIAAQLRNGTDSILANNAYTAGDALNESSLDLNNL